MTDDLSTRLLAAISKVEEAANRMQHDNPDDGGFYACPATRTEPYGDLGHGEDACDCGMPYRRAEALRFCQAHREIVEQYVTARKNSGPTFGGLRDLDHASAMGRVTALGLVLQALCRAYGLEETP